MNWLAIFCAAAAYWVLGFIWYSVLFGKIWAAEIKCIPGDRTAPAPAEMAAKLISTFVSNLVAATAMAYLLQGAGIIDMERALGLGAVVGIGFAITAITMTAIWESKSTKVWAIDASYNFFGCLLLAAILVSWR
jgi:hypothetical protein